MSAERNGEVDDWLDWTADDAREWIAQPVDSDDKYSRGVLGVVTGSDRYPGAAVLGVEAAVRTGVGMVRYLGATRPTDLVLQRRPEVVTATGRVQAWLLGSGMDAAARPEDDAVRLRSSLDEAVPFVIDAGALDLVGQQSGPAVITPHYRELSAALAHASKGQDAAPTAGEIAADPAGWAALAAERLGVTVLLKGHTTFVAAPRGARLRVTAGTSWLATAGSGDVLGGVLGALAATHADSIAGEASVLAKLAATAAHLHGRAGVLASGGGPIAALDIAEALPRAVAELLG